MVPKIQVSPRRRLEKNDDVEVRGKCRLSAKNKFDRGKSIGSGAFPRIQKNVTVFLLIILFAGLLIPVIALADQQNQSQMSVSVSGNSTPAAQATKVPTTQVAAAQIRSKVSVVAKGNVTPAKSQVQAMKAIANQQEEEADYYFYCDEPISITSQIYNYYTGQGIPGVYYQFQKSVDGSTWEVIGDGYTDQNGYAYLPYYTEHNPNFLYYQAVFWTNAMFTLPIGTIQWVPTTASFTGSPTSGTVPLAVQFTDASMGAPPVSWQWNFGDGSGGSTLQNPSYTYSTPGNFTVSLTITTAYGSYSSTQTNYIRAFPPAPVASFTGTPTSGTAPLTVSFTDTSTGSPTSWSWLFGDGGTSSAQNPTYTYNSTGTYTVSLMALNAGGSNIAVETGYVTVMPPGTPTSTPTETPTLTPTPTSTPAPSNQATDIPGRSIYQSDVATAASQQQLMNYQPTIFYPAKQSDIIPRLPNDQIFFFFGHGLEGEIQLNDTLAFPDATLFYGTNNANSFDEASASYSNMNLAVLLACKAGGTSPTYGNIVDIIASKGGSCAIGWTENLLDWGGVNDWSATFWNRVQDGDPILNAYDEGVGAAESNLDCQEVYKTWPGVWDAACNLTKVHYAENNDGCSQPLPNGLASQMVSANNVNTTTQTMSSLSSDRKNQIINSVSTFAEKPVNNIEYQDIIHQPYADLYQVKTDDSTYWVNANNGRVQSMTVSRNGSETTTRIIDLDEGSRIAESYAKEKYPELWNVSDGKGIKQIVKRTNDLESGQTFEYSWQEIFYPPGLNSSENTVIPGPNLVTITVNPYTGEVIQYHEWYVPNDATLNLTPSLTEDDAMRYAESYFQVAGFENINPDNISSPGLNIAVDENNQQHLTWSFELDQKDASNLDKSGFVGIDAHNGEVVWHASIT